MHDIISRLNNKSPEAALRPQFTGWNIIQESTYLMKQRLPLYKNAANHTVETANKNPLQIAEEIYQYLVESGNLIKIIKSKK
jgi:shikimate kinase